MPAETARIFLRHLNSPSTLFPLHERFSGFSFTDNEFSRNDVKATIITVGDELLIGQVVNTNAAWLGDRLHAAGVQVVESVMVGDSVSDIGTALRKASVQSDLILLTGGLGPTHDDVTRQAVSAFFGVDLVPDEAVFEQIKQRFASRKRPMAAANRVQAMVPAGFDVLPNPRGTAPGLMRYARTGERPAIVVLLPGVPHEMKGLFTDQVLPRIQDQPTALPVVQRTLLTTGIGESSLQERIGDLSDVLSESVKLAYLPGRNGVRLRLTARASSKETAERMLEPLETRIRRAAAPFLFGENDDKIEELVGRLLAERGLTVAIAESCTGGLVAHRLTNVPGSSAYMAGGIVAYANRVKVELLGVDPSDLARDGAVSERIARQMAEGVRRVLGADVGIATTGVAGPAGGSPEKPVGTAWIGISDARETRAWLRHFSDDRALNKELTTTAVLYELKKWLTT